MEEAPVVVSERCSICSAIADSSTNFCGSCGYPLQGSSVEKANFEKEYAKKRGSYGHARDEAQKGTTTLYWLSGLAFVANVVYYFIQNEAAYLVAAILVPVIFLALAQWSKKNAFAALLVALIFYVTLNVSAAIVDPATIAKGLIFKGIIIYFLARGAKSGYEAAQLEKDLAARNWNQ